MNACLADISQCMSAHHLKLTLDKTKLLFLPGKESPIHDLSIVMESSVVSQTWTARNLGVILDNQLSFRYQHLSDNQLLQIRPPQHQEDMSIPHPGGSAGSCPSLSSHALTTWFNHVPTSRTWLNHTPQPIHNALLLLNGLLLPHHTNYGHSYRSTKSQCSWLHNGGTSSPLTSGQQTLFTLSNAD